MLLRKSFLAAFLILLTLAPQLQLVLNGQGKERGRPPIAFETNILSIPRAHALEGGDFFLSDIGQKFFVGSLHALTILNWFALSAVQALLSPDVIFGQKLDPTTGAPSPTGIRTMELILRNIWVTSRNIVNGIFAFILLFAGIYLIVKADSYAMGKIKSGAKNFVLAVILVNFSWFFPRVILDMSSVLTSVIYQLPALVSPGLPCSGEVRPGPDEILGTVDDEEIPCRYVWRVRFFPTMGHCAKVPTPPDCFRPVADDPSLGPPQWGKSYWDFVDVFYAKWNTVARNGKYINYGELDPATGLWSAVPQPVSGADVIVNGLAVNFAKIPSFDLIDFEDMWRRFGAARGAKEISAAFLKYFIELIMHVVLSLAVGLALLALAAVLVVRVAVLWLTIAFMPFVFIGFALRGPGGMGELPGAGGAEVPNIWKTFLSYAFLPALVAVPFAVGFTLMSQLYYVKVMTIPLPIPGVDTILPKGIDSFHEFLWMIISIAIIWFGVFSILAKDKIAGGIVQGIRGIGTTAVKTAGYGALSIPIIPLPGGGRVGPMQLLDRFKQLPEAIRFRGIAGAARGGAPPPPTPERIDRAAEKMTREGFEDLRRTIGKADASIDTFAQRLAALSGNTLNRQEAMGLITHEPSLRQFLQKGVDLRKLDAGERDEMLRTATRLREAAVGGAAGGAGAAAPTVRVNLNVNEYITKSAEDIKKDVAKEYFNTPGMDARSVKRDLEANIERATAASVKEAIREVASQIREDMDVTALKEKLREINPDLPP